jgi:uncharacterized protein YbjT (DUF2867 family)
MIQSKRALLVGANGLVGSELLKFLLEAREYQKVIVFVRRSLGINHPKYEERLVDFEKLHKHRADFCVQDVFCCLGTTIKKAKTQATFKKVDVDYPLELARLAQEFNVEKFLIISSMGADVKSKVFYSRMKGLIEDELIKLRLKSLHIFRPSLLLGNRREFRIGETIGGMLAKGLSFTFIGPLMKYKPITARNVAKAMYKIAQLKTEGVNRYTSEKIARIAES